MSFVAASYNAPTTFRSSRRNRPGAKKPSGFVRFVAKATAGFAILVAGVTLGHASTLASPEAHRPDAATLAQLSWAQQHGGQGCRAEWVAEHKVFDVICNQRTR